MEPHDVLLGTSELAIGLIGFAGVVVAFAGAPEEHSAELYRIRLAGLLGGAGSALILSLFPLYFLAGTELDRVSWAAFSGVQGLVLLIFAGFFLRAWFRLGAGSKVLGAIGVAGTAVLAIFQFASFIGSGGFQQYLGGILWQLAFSALLFVRMAQVMITNRG